MKKNVVADTSFFICHACNLKSYDLLHQYLDLYTFHAGPIITQRELPHLGTQNEEIRSKISIRNNNYTELFKALSPRTSDHLTHDGEYEAIGIAIELSLTQDLHCLILDDNGPKNFAKNHIAPLFPELSGKIHGTVGFIANSHRIDKLNPKSNCIDHLKAIYQAYLTYQASGKPQRPCGMDPTFVRTTLLPLISELENSNE